MLVDGVRRNATRQELQEAYRLWSKHKDIREGRFEEAIAAAPAAAEPIATLDGYRVTEQGWWVCLTMAECEYAWKVAGERDRKALAANANPDKHAVEGVGRHELVELTTRERNYVGCLGEEAAAKRLDVDWSGARKSWAEDDDVSGIQVRATIYQNGALRSWGADVGQPIILAIVYKAGAVRLAGWKQAGAGRRWGDATFVPQHELDPMETFPKPDNLPGYVPPDG